MFYYPFANNQLQFATCTHHMEFWYAHSFIESISPGEAFALAPPFGAEILADVYHD
jgi:hypothetical protein